MFPLGWSVPSARKGPRCVKEMTSSQPRRLKISELCQGLEEASAREAEWRQKLLRQDQEYQDALTKVSQIESLRRELDTLRQVAIGTLQVSLSTQDGGSLLEGFSIDAPDSRNQVRR